MNIFYHPTLVILKQTESLDVTQIYCGNEGIQTKPQTHPEN